MIGAKYGKNPGIYDPYAELGSYIVERSYDDYLKCLTTLKKLNNPSFDDLVRTYGGRKILVMLGDLEQFFDGSEIKMHTGIPGSIIRERAEEVSQNEDYLIDIVKKPGVERMDPTWNREKFTSRFPK